MSAAISQQKGIVGIEDYPRPDTNVRELFSALNSLNKHEADEKSHTIYAIAFAAFALLAESFIALVVCWYYYSSSQSCEKEKKWQANKIEKLLGEMQAPIKVVHRHGCKVLWNYSAK